MDILRKIVIMQQVNYLCVCGDFHILLVRKAKILQLIYLHFNDCQLVGITFQIKNDATIKYEIQIQKFIISPN